MRKLLQLISVILVAACLAGCAGTVQTQTQAAVPLGAEYVDLDGAAYPAYWLEERINGQWERVALVFGYVDDGDVCEEWAAWRRSKYDLDEYRCSEVVGQILYSQD